MDGAMTQEIISPIEKQQILDEINKWLDSIYPYKRPAAELCDHINRDSDFFRIDAHRKKFRLYLRFGKTWVSSRKKSIVISQISFDKKRSGHGTALLKLLTKLAKMYHYELIAIESVNDNSRAFALRFNFCGYDSDNNYIIDTESLHGIFEKEMSDF